jgi:large subunit ribosomal protein L11
MKNIQAVLKLQLPAGEATPGPPLGPTLGQYGVNIQDFIKKFNDQTADQKGAVLPLKLIDFQDRSFEFHIKQPLVAYLLKQAAQVDKGSGTPNLKKAGKVSKADIERIAKQKMQDFNTRDLKKAMKIVEGTARSLGIEVK